MAIEQLIKKEMTPRTVHHWGEKYDNFTPELINRIHGDGQILMYVMPLSDRPHYYIMRVDSSVRQMIKDDGDEINELLDTELLDNIEDEYGLGEYEDDDGELVNEPWPALDLSCGYCWGECK